MEEAALHKIEIGIAGRKYPIKVTASEEPLVRKIEDRLNQQIQDFQLKYPDRDKLDCVIMTLLTESFEHTQSDSQKEEENNLIQRLNHIEALLDAAPF